METEDGGVACVADPLHFTVQAQGEGGGAGAGGGGGEARGGSLELGRRLLAAARDGDCEAVLELMSHGAPFTTDWLGTSALHAAAARGQAAAAALLLRAGALRDARSKVERTPLHVAAHAGHDDVCALLLLHGARVDCRDMLGMTPLAWAVERGAARAAQLLLARGADPDLPSKFRTSPRDLARKPGREKFIEMIDKAMKDRASAASTAPAASPAPGAPAAPGTPEASVPPLTPVTTSTPAKKEKSEKREFIIISDPKKIASSKVSEPTKKINHDFANKRASSSPKKSSSDKEGAPGAGAAVGSGAGAGDAGAAARLLRAHGITMTPPDTAGGTVLAALQAGRTVLLSDAGKIMLKESSQVSASSAAGAPSGGGAGRAGGAAVPPRRILPRVAANITLKKIVNSSNKQVRYMALPAGAGAAGGAGARAAGGAALPVSVAPGVVRVPAEFLTSTSIEYLRAQLLAAHAELSAARARAAALQARLDAAAPTPAPAD